MSIEYEFEAQDLADLDELDELDEIDWSKAGLQLLEPESSLPNCNTAQYKDPTSSHTDVRLPSIEGFDEEKGKTWQYPIDFPLRDYQFSIVRRCLFTNTLVCLPTGLGKTFIAAVVMLNFYRWYPDGKIVFMAPTKPLVNQQIQACCNITALPKYEVAELTGATSAQKRIVLWKQNRVFFLTPQVMQNDLSSGICPAKEIVCCVIDEAHKALGNYAYTQVVRELVVNSVKFRVLALSATPGDDLTAIQEVINNLLISCIELRTEESIDVVPYTHHRKIEKYVVKLDGTLGEVNVKFLNVLGGIAKRLYANKAVYTDDAKKLGRFQLIKARENFRNSVSGAFIGPVEGEFAVGISLYHSYELLYSSGIRACYLSIKRLLSDGRSSSRLHSEVVKNTELNQIMSKMEKLVDSMHKFFIHTNSMDPNVSIVAFGDDVTIDLTSSLATDSFFYSHPKLLKLEEVVVTHFRTASTADNLSTRVMIFSSYRDSVEEISVMLHRHTPLVRVMCFHGHGSRPGGAQGQKGFTQKEQLKVMERFRGGGYNVLVSTCVGEEGLDIGDVDLIICFDSPKAPTRYVQRMGRTGRKREGRIVILLSEGKEEQAYQKCQSSKKHIYKIVTEGRKHLNFYSNSLRMVPTHFSPQPNKLYLQQQEEEEEVNKPAILTRGVSNVKKKHTKCTDKLPGFSTAMNQLKNKGNPHFSKEDIAKSLVNYSLSQQETLRIQQRLSTYTGVREILCLKDEQEIQDNSCVSNAGGLDCSEWLYCQTSIQTGLVSHSTKSQSMIDLIKTFDHLKNSENAVEEYESALHINTTQQSIQTGFNKLSLKTNINQRSRVAKNKKKHTKIDGSDSECLLECSTTPTHNNNDTKSPVKLDSIEHPFASATVRQRIFTLESSSDEANSDDNKQHKSRNSSPSPPRIELSFCDDTPPDISTRYNDTHSYEDPIHSPPQKFDDDSVEIDFFDIKTPKATNNTEFDSPTHTPVSSTHLTSLNLPGISLLSKTSTPNKSSNITDIDIICIDTTDEKLRDCIKISPLLNPITSPSFIEDIPGAVNGKKKINCKNTRFESSDSENEAFKSLCRKRKFQSKRRMISSQFSPALPAAPNNPRKKRKLNCFIDNEAIESDGECSNSSFKSPPTNDTSSSVYTEDNSAVSRLIADTSVSTTGYNESSVYARYVRDIISPTVAPVSKLVIDPKRHRILATAGKNIIKFKERRFDSVITDSSVDYEAEEVYGVIDEEAERLLFQSPTNNKSNSIFTPPHPVKSANSIILIDSNVTDKEHISFSLGMDDWMEDPISVNSVKESKQPSLENRISSKITNSPLKQTFSLGMDDWWEDIDPGDLDTDFLTNNPPSQTQGKSEILPSTPSLTSQSTTTTTTQTSTPVLSSLTKEFSLPLSVTHSPVSSANNAIVINSFSSAFKSPYYSTTANQSSLMTSSLSNSESSIVIFADTREVSGSQILSSLRIHHGICIHVYSLKHCSYLVSSRMAVDRHNVSDLSQQNSTQKIIDRARSMCELYERCSVIVERDRVKSKLQSANKTALGRNQLFLTNLARLCKSRISVLFSGSEQNTIDILASLSKQEAKRGHKITGSLFQVDTPLFKFICCIPKISPTIGLNLATSLKNLNQLYISTPVELKKVCVCITKEQIDSIRKILTHRYKSYALIQ